VTFECPGTLTVKAGKKSFTGAGSENVALPTMPGGTGYMRRYVVHRITDGQPLAQQKYRLTLADGRVIEGMTDAQGQTELAQAESMQLVRLELLHN
jgi:type VI secretion system secreted protein VgrG